MSLVVAVVGTDHHPFDRLVEWVDAAALRHPEHRFFVQHGASTPPTVAEGAPYVSHAELSSMLGEAAVMVCHGGPGTIMDARQVLLVAQGAGKSAAVAAAVEGPVSALCPASVLQFHEHATVIIDRAAAADLTLVEYYQHTYANKPEWQRF